MDEWMRDGVAYTYKKKEKKNETNKGIKGSYMQGSPKRADSWSRLSSAHDVKQGKSHWVIYQEIYRQIY